jgi:hypothetical protein
MREIAQAQASHPGVQYLAGSAEQLPVPSGSAGYALAAAWSRPLPRIQACPYPATTRPC